MIKFVTMECYESGVLLLLKVLGFTILVNIDYHQLYKQCQYHKSNIYTTIVALQLLGFTSGEILTSELQLSGFFIDGEFYLFCFLSGWSQSIDGDILTNYTYIILLLFSIIISDHQ